MNQELGRYKIFIYKKSFIVLFAFVSLILNSCFLIFTPPHINADEAVSATVPPRLSDFQFNLSSSSPQPITQGEDVSYQITYGSNTSAAFPTNITIVANWNDITAPNNSQIFDYEIGSASNGYGDAVPVVDMTNKTITWTIPNVPAGTTDQTVNFKLKTITNYNKVNPFSFTINAIMSNQYVMLPEQTLTQTYQYKTSPPGLGPTVQPTIPVVSPTPTPTPTVRFNLNNVSITGLSDSGTTIQATTNEPAKLVVRYGTSPKALTKTVAANTYTFVHTTNLSGLTADKTYYFQAIATNADGTTISSDIFTFHTAKKSVMPSVENDIIVLSSNGNILNSDSQKENDLKNPSIILTNNSDYTIAYTLTNPIQLKSIDVILINKILATHSTSHSTLRDEPSGSDSKSSGQASDGPSEFIFPMLQKTPTLYVADLQTLPQGVYEVDVRLVDTNGNIIEKQLSDLKIMPQLIVYGADTRTPLSDARIYISYYDEQTQRYEPVTSSLFGSIKNPSYTDTFGQSPITLPAGRYRIEESSLFYDAQMQDFTIGPKINQNFPILYLKKDPFNLISLFTYTKDYLGDSWTKMLSILFATSSSVRIYHLVALEILGTFVFLTFFSFLFRSHLSFKHLPIFILFHLGLLFKKRHLQYIFGNIVDEQNNPISRVLIEIEDAETKNILSHGQSHKTGKFYFTNSHTNPVNLIFIKDGYESFTFKITDETVIPELGFHIKMIKGTPHHETIVSAFMIGLEDGFSMLFEAFLVSSLVLEILFSIFLRTQITLPFFFILSLLNIILWLFYLHEHNASS